MEFLKNLPKTLKLLLFLVIAFLLDLLAYSLTTVCSNCASFSQFLSHPASLAGPILASLTVLLTKGEK